MDSDSGFQLQQNQSNSGLLRFRSAPGPVVSNLKRGEGDGGGNNPYEDSESERVALKFLNSSETDSTSLRELVDINTKPSTSKSSAPLSRMNSQQGYGSSSYSPSQFQRHNSMEMDQRPKSSNPNLLRQSSFPAVGYFSNNISFQNGNESMKGVGNYGGVNGSLSMNRLRNQISFTSREGIGATSPDDGRQRGNNGNGQYYGPGFPYGSWNETSQFSNKLIIGSKRELIINDESLSDAQNGDVGNQVHRLSHHLSLPNRASSEIFAMENMLHFPDSVPCKIRAKRGFATHPRSIAERERRTRISERIRKLQELVPNMEKQTSTADMLDLAVGYIKDLQKQFKSLSEKRARCKCISMKKLETNQIS